MKGMCFMVFAAITFYTAGMYRSFPLMALFLTELLLMLMMRGIVLQCRKKLQVEWTAAGIAGERLGEIRCTCRVTNKGKIPVRQFRLRCRYYDCRMQKKKTLNIYGRAECGTNDLCFCMRVPYCGNTVLKLEQIQIYDPMSLFSISERLCEQMTAAVFPQTEAMRIEMSSFACQQMREGAEPETDGIGSAQGEIRQIREYRPGDSVRRIHWNLSAKTDRLWVKEYENEADGCLDILLDMDEWNRYGAVTKDAFYRILSALISGLLQNSWSARVIWPDTESGRIAQKYITQTEQIRDMLLCLYRMDISDEKLEKYELSYRTCFRLNLSLQWYLNQTLIYQFHEPDLDQEIAEKVFIL